MVYGFVKVVLADQLAPYVDAACAETRRLSRLLVVRGGAVRGADLW